MLEAEIRERRKQREILLMSHIVLGYPSFDACLGVVEQMVHAGVDLMELQIPFSEPIADGPVILHANQKALAAGSSVDRCFELARRLTREFPIPFLFMTYYNIVWQRGIAHFVAEMQDAGLQGAIVPDLPFEEGGAMLSAMAEHGVDPVFIYSPSTSEARMQAIGKLARGFVYCVARKGVTGASTEFAGLGDYLARCRQHTALPLALGFGIKQRADVEAVTGRVDIAVVGSETIRVIDEQGVGAVGPFIRSLR